MGGTRSITRASATYWLRSDESPTKTIVLPGMCDSSSRICETSEVVSQHTPIDAPIAADLSAGGVKRPMRVAWE